MTEQDFVPKQHLSYSSSTRGQVGWKAPSNIALVKYWGKTANQIPANPSISFTLDACATKTTLTFERLDGEAKDFFF